MDKSTVLSVPLRSVEHTADELRAIIEAHLGGIPVVVYRDGDQGWNASLDASSEVKARYEQRLQEILLVMHEYQLTLREEIDHLH